MSGPPTSVTCRAVTPRGARCLNPARNCGKASFCTSHFQALKRGPVTDHEGRAWSLQEVAVARGELPKTPRQSLLERAELVVEVPAPPPEREVPVSLPQSSPSVTAGLSAEQQERLREAEAIPQCLRLLAGLDEAARERVLRYVSAALGVELAAPTPATGERQHHRKIAGLLRAEGPKTGGQLADHYGVEFPVLEPQLKRLVSRGSLWLKDGTYSVAAGGKR